ncbi:hypothetical protein DQ354_15935 [Arthrobacter sp. AQ5-06]|nr:hypothetical protein DQ354_15935 [Arthrobacter sp. AQ5-06]
MTPLGRPSGWSRSSSAGTGHWRSCGSSAAPVHEGGDALLVLLAERLRASVRSHDLVARLGGDEFVVVVLDNDDGTPATGAVAERIYEELSEPFVIGGRSLRVSLSIGVAQWTADVTELLRQADSAMYRAKDGGRPGTKSTVVEPAETPGG